MRVGTSLIFPSPLHRGQDHPHACGDKCSARAIDVCILGSSPCVWGQDFHCYTSLHSFRIIPMRVGTRGNSFRSAVRTEDHPHACGDKLTDRLATSLLQGSSPCVWGQAFYIFPFKNQKRIIPMRVGTR